MARFDGVRSAALEANRIGAMGSEGNLSQITEKWTFGPGQALAVDDTLESRVLELGSDSILLDWQVVFFGEDMPTNLGFSLDRKPLINPEGAGGWERLSNSFITNAANIREFRFGRTAAHGGDPVFFDVGRNVTASDPDGNQARNIEDKQAYRYRLRCHQGGFGAVSSGNSRTVVSYTIFGNL